MTTSMAERLGYADYLRLPETEQRTEVVEGLVVVNAMPTGPHQLMVHRLSMALEQQCPPGLQVFPGWDWVLRPEPLLVRVPDVLVFPAALRREPRLTVPPLLAVEVLSADSAERDLVTKRREYAEAGLRHYLVGDPQAPALQYFTARDGRLVEAGYAAGSQPLPLPAPFDLVLVPNELA